MSSSFPIGEIIRGFWSLLTGMWITLKEFYKPNVTLHYPYQHVRMAPRFRGHIEMLKEPVTGHPVCTACTLCAKACPSVCITVEGVKLEGMKRKISSKYELDFTKCSLCGACVEVCPVDAIRFSKDYNLAGTSRETYVMDLLKNMKEKAP